MSSGCQGHIEFKMCGLQFKEQLHAWIEVCTVFTNF